MTDSRLIRLAAVIGLALTIAAAPARAELHVTVDQANVQPMPIAIPDFAAPTAGDTVAGQNIAKVIRADLDRSGLFRPLDPKAFIEKITNINTAPAIRELARAERAGAGRRPGAEPARRPAARRFPAVGRLWREPDDRPAIFHHARQLAPHRAHHRRRDLPAHHRREGLFRHRVVFISESGPALARKKRLAVMDQDGANPIFLTRGDYLVLTPRFNPTAQMIAYMSYIGTKPRSICSTWRAAGRKCSEISRI
ncbi:MAG: hypothetical protein WDM81_11325 [Rhizomicrobium sp.]